MAPKTSGSVAKYADFSVFIQIFYQFFNEKSAYTGIQINEENADFIQNLYRFFLVFSF